MYGDLDAEAKRFAKKTRSRSTSKSSKANAKEAGQEGQTESEFPNSVSDDPLCSHLVELEVAPLRAEIEALKEANAKLQQELDEANFELIHEDL